MEAPGCSNNLRPSCKRMLFLTSSFYAQGRICGLCMCNKAVYISIICWVPQISVNFRIDDFIATKILTVFTTVLHEQLILYITRSSPS